MKKEKLEKLALERSNPCVTISLNTHRTFPDNAQDAIFLKNLCNEAEKRLIAEFSKKDISSLLEKLKEVPSNTDANYNLDSLHIFLSNDTYEVIKSPWKTPHDAVSIAESFAVKPLIKVYNRTKQYFILLLSQSGVQLFQAINDSISGEIKNDSFPFAQNSHYLTDKDQLSDAKKVDNMVREFLRDVDKAMMKVYNKTGLQTVVICTEDNYSRLIQVADRPSIYYGYSSINYNDTSNHTIAANAWKMVNALQIQNRSDSVNEMMEAVGNGKVVTDLAEIFRTVKEGRGDLLIVHDNFHQAVRMTGEFSFDLVSDVTEPGVIDDIVSDIAWEVISKKGRVVFTEQDKIKSLGEIVLKLRY
jgi:hypothetical protein